jgi:hypothetical protein
MFDELWAEIQDSPGEIFDIEDRKSMMETNPDDLIGYDDQSVGDSTLSYGF